jgi:hypothetical protein
MLIYNIFEHIVTLNGTANVTFDPKNVPYLMIAQTRTW